MIQIFTVRTKTIDNQVKKQFHGHRLLEVVECSNPDYFRCLKAPGCFIFKQDCEIVSVETITGGSYEIWKQRRKREVRNLLADRRSTRAYDPPRRGRRHRSD